MKRKTSLQIKRFRFKFSPKIVVLCILTLLLCLAGIATTVYRIVKNDGIHGFTDFLKFPLLIAVCVFCIVLVVSLLIKSEYTVEKEAFTTKFGFIKTKFPLKTITEIELDRDEHKLTVRCGEEFSVLSVSPEWQEDFASELIKANPDIEYSYTLPQAKPEDKKDDEEKKDK